MVNLNEFYEKGYQVLEDILSVKKTHELIEKIENIYKQQVQEFGVQQLEKIGELNTIRSPFLYDKEFIKLFYNDFTNDLIQHILGEYAILSLQNAVKVVSKIKHHQTKYHRDLIHQEFTSSRPIAFNIYYCLTDFNKYNGGITFIPKSHATEKIGSNFIEKTPDVKSGSVIIFNSMVFHKAGHNQSLNSRIGINNMYTLPFVKQQINYSKHFKNLIGDKKLSRILGFESKEFESVNEFRNYRLSRYCDEK